MAERRSDRELLEGAQRGDPTMIEELLERHEKSIYRFGLRMCGSEDAARDVLQETLFSAFKNLPEFRGDAELSTWLFQIARSFCIKARRRHVGEPTSMASLDSPAVREAPSEQAGPDAKAQAKEIGQAISAAMLGLAENHREVVILKDVEGLSADEIARVLGDDVAAVKSRLHRARLELRRSLAALLDEAELPSPCPELTEALMAYVSQDIDQAACVTIEAHLAACPRCRAACQDLQRTVSLCRRIPGDSVPPAVQKAIRHALRQRA